MNIDIRIFDYIWFYSVIFVVFVIFVIIAVNSIFAVKVNKKKT